MPRPDSRVEAGAGGAVELETTVGSGQFRLDPYLHPEEIVLESGEKISRARLAVRLGAELSPRQARRRYQADRRVMVRTDEPSAGRRHMLFEGYLQEMNWWWTGEQGPTTRMVIEARHVAERLATDPRSQIIGRAVRSMHIERRLQADPMAWSHRSESLTGLPCRFNAAGRGNRSPENLRVSTSTGQDLTIPLFVEDHSPAATRWTYGEVLRYLVWFHLPADGSVGPGNAYQVTQYLDDPAATSPLGKVLLECPRDLVCEATNLLEALLLVTAEAGLRFHVETINVDGRARSQLKVWDPASGQPRRLSLGGRPWDSSAAPDAQMAGESLDTFLDRNNTHRGGSRKDRAAVVTSPVVVGGAKRYEIVAELVPGWLPEKGLDDVAPADRNVMKAQAMTEEMILAGAPETFSHQWYTRYHRQGGEHDLHGAVARKWVLNEAGDYDGQVYNRSTPFDSYEPFDFASAVGADRTDARHWMRRRRRLLALPSNHATGAPGRLLVEISFDSGTTWSEPPCEVSVLADECGVFLDCLNPTDLAAPEQDRRQQNMWYALIDGTFRLRVRALVESDERVLVRGVDRAGGDASATPRSMVVYRPDDFQFVRSSAETIDDTPIAQQYADRLARHMSGDIRQSLGAIPWLDCACQIGDSLLEPRGFGEGLAVAVILAKRYLLAEGRAETELYGGPVFPLAESP